MLDRNSMATVDRIILDLNDLVKDSEVKNEPLVQGIGVSPLITDFKQLDALIKSIVHDKKNEEKAFNNLVEEIRRKTRIILENEAKDDLSPPRFSKQICDEIFEIQIKMAKISPINAKDVSGKYQDPIFLEEIDDIHAQDIVAFSNGYMIPKNSLTEYFNRNNAFRIVNDSIQVRHPVDGALLSERDVTSLRAQGVNIPQPPRGMLEINRVLGLGGERIDGSANSAGGLLGSIPFSVSTISGAVAGYALGALVGIIAILALIITCPLTGPIFYSLLGVSILGGLIEKMKTDGQGFSQGFFWSVAPSMIIVSLASLIAPPVIGFLAAQHIIASIDIATKTWPLIQAGIPAALGAIGLVAELVQRGNFERFFKGIYKNAMRLFTNTFGIIGAIGGIIIFNVLGRLCCRPSLDDGQARRDMGNSLEINRVLLAHANGNDDELAQVLGARPQRPLLVESVDHTLIDQSHTAMQQATLQSSSVFAAAEQTQIQPRAARV